MTYPHRQELQRALEKLDREIHEASDLTHAEMALYSIASALKKLHRLPEELRDEATPPDKLLAYLVSKGHGSPHLVEATAMLLEYIGRRVYNFEEEEKQLLLARAEEARADVYQALRGFLEG